MTCDNKTMKENTHLETSLATMSVPFIDDKASICIPFILTHLESHRSTAPSPSRPLIVGLNGMQGVGKTTLVAQLAEGLAKRNIRTLVFSLDDFYLTHQDQVALAEANPDNALVQHRGEPGIYGSWNPLAIESLKK